MHRLQFPYKDHDFQEAWLALIVTWFSAVVLRGGGISGGNAATQWLPPLGSTAGPLLLLLLFLLNPAAAIHRHREQPCDYRHYITHTARKLGSAPFVSMATVMWWLQGLRWPDLRWQPAVAWPPQGVSPLTLSSPLRSGIRNTELDPPAWLVF